MWAVIQPCDTQMPPEVPTGYKWYSPDGNHYGDKVARLVVEVVLDGVNEEAESGAETYFINEEKIKPQVEMRPAEKTFVGLTPDLSGLSPGTLEWLDAKSQSG